jgi:hypothetical protein
MMGLPAATSPHPLIDCHLGLLWKVQDLHLPHIIGCIPNPNHRLFERQTNNWGTLISDRSLGAPLDRFFLLSNFLFGSKNFPTPSVQKNVILGILGQVRAGLMNTLAAGDSYRDLVWWWRVLVGFNAQKRGSRPITTGAVHAHWFSPSSRERAAKRPFRVSLSFLLDVARFTVIIILALIKEVK